MAINKNWPRWVFASMCKHFKDGLSSYTLHIEGNQRQENVQKDLLELRLDGPYFNVYSKGVTLLYIEVNILIQTVMREDNFQTIHQVAGDVAAQFSNGIPIYRYGPATDADNDDTFLGCMKLAKDQRGRPPVMVSHFGQVDPDTKILQAVVEGHYEMMLID